MNRIFLGRPDYWAILLIFAAALFGMGSRHLHVRAFVPFLLGLLALTAAGLGYVVWRYRPGEDVCREPLDGAALPHAGAEEGEEAG